MNQVHILDGVRSYIGTKNSSYLTAKFIPGPHREDVMLQGGYMNGNGYLHFAGRNNNVYNIHGWKISALKIENALLGLDEVLEAAVSMEGGGCSHRLCGVEPLGLPDSAKSAPTPSHVSTPSISGGI